MARPLKMKSPTDSAAFIWSSFEYATFTPADIWCRPMTWEKSFCA